MEFNNININMLDIILFIGILNSLIIGIPLKQLVDYDD